MLKAHIMFAFNPKLVFYPYTVTVNGKLTRRGWTLRWVKFHLQYERMV